MSSTDDTFFIENDDSKEEENIKDEDESRRKEELLYPSIKKYNFSNLSKDVIHRQWNPWDESLVSTNINAHITISENVPNQFTTIYDVNIMSNTNFKSKLNTLQINDTTRRLYIYNNNNICHE